MPHLAAFLNYVVVVRFTTGSDLLALVAGIEWPNPCIRVGKFLWSRLKQIGTCSHMDAEMINNTKQHTLQKQKQVFFPWPTDPKQGSSHSKVPIHSYEEDLSCSIEQDNPSSIPLHEQWAEVSNKPPASTKGETFECPCLRDCGHGYRPCSAKNLLETTQHMA